MIELPVTLDTHASQSEEQVLHTVSGYCESCESTHTLAAGIARGHGRTLMQELQEKKRIDLALPAEHSEPRCATDYLFGEAMGQMFGAMVCEKEDGSHCLLKAFSCQYNGMWQVPGWVPPLFDVDAFYDLTHDVERRVKSLGREMESVGKESPQWARLKKERKQLSQELMKEIHALYRLTNFNGETRTLYDVFPKGKGIPTGVGDCCAPKLLNYAARNNLTPLGITEFYWGKENRSQTRQHGTFYPACKDKCEPILGFMLCGLDKRAQNPTGNNG